MPTESILAQAIAEQATPLVGSPSDFDVLIDHVGASRFVLLGAATQGSHELYRLRAELTKRLIREKGFTVLALEADGPDAQRVDRFARGVADDAFVEAQRFPQWTWRNADALELFGWLRRHNEGCVPARRVAVHGLDVYALHASTSAVLELLDERDPEGARRARTWYASFDEVGDEPLRAGRPPLDLEPEIADDVVAHLVALARRRSPTQVHEAEAAAYYRRLHVGAARNLRARHMADRLDAVAAELPRDARVVVWGHNAQIGDAAAMSLRAERDEITLGHLCRMRHPRETFLVGFTTFDGTITAASQWGGATERKALRAALPGSYEALFHRTGVPSFALSLRDLGEATAALHEARLERAIGVVYRPQAERWSHYCDVSIADQLDAVIHVDHTRAIEPLDRTALWERGEFPHAFPSDL